MMATSGLLAGGLDWPLDWPHAKWKSIELEYFIKSLIIKRNNKNKLIQRHYVLKLACNLKTRFKEEDKSSLYVSACNLKIRIKKVCQFKYYCIENVKIV